jgi:hypothetical protein
MSAVLSRRFFFQLSTERLALLALASQVSACAKPAPDAIYRALGVRELTVLGAIAATLLPPTRRLPVELADTSLLIRVDRFLADGDPLLAAQFRLLLHGFDRYPQWLSRHFTRFSRLEALGRAEVLESFAGSRLYGKRMVYTTIKAVVCNHYFADPLVMQSLGYKPVCGY